MFETKDIIGDAVKRAVKLFASRKRGDVVPWEEIEKIAGFERFSTHWPAFDRRFRRDFLRETGIALWPIHGTGLNLCTQEFQLKELPLRRQIRAHRQFTRSLRAVTAIPDSELTTHQRVLKSHKIEQLRTAKRKVLYSIRLGHQLAKPSSVGMPKPSRVR